MFEYNTSRNRLSIKEYGRNVQKMIEHALTIEDREKRNQTAKAIVRVMAEIHPETNDNQSQNEQNTYSEDYWRKLWDHLIIISDYKLDIDSPFPKPTIDEENDDTQKHHYQKSKIMFRTYGRNIENIIKKVSQYPPAQREIMGKWVANHLKKLYLTYNRNSVTDALIIEQLKELSGGNINLSSDLQLVSTKDILRCNGNAHIVQAGSNIKTGKKTKRKKKKPNQNHTNGS